MALLQTRSRGAIVPEKAGDRTQVRLALALNGGVSLAVWIGGVVNEVLRACKPSGPYAKLVEPLKLDVRADVLTGTSAGGLNAIFLALGLLYEHDNLDALRDVWVEVGDFSELLRDPLDAKAPSLLKGDEFFLPELRHAIRGLMNYPKPKAPKEIEVDVTLTVTSLSGEVYKRPDDYGGLLKERGHAAVIHLTDRKAFEKTDDNVERLARACRSTAAFPGAFEPSFVRVKDAENDAEPDAPKNVENAAEPESPKDSKPDARKGGAFTKDEQIEGVLRDRFLVDGGVLVNLPAGRAIEAIFNKAARGKVTRVLGLVVPDPATMEFVSGDEESSPPGLLSVVGASASGIPRTQSVRQFLDEVRSRNSEVKMVQRQRLSLMGGIGSLAKLVALARSLFPAYRDGRRAGSMAEAHDQLSHYTERMEGLTAEQMRQWRGVIEWVFGEGGPPLPWIPPSGEVWMPPSVEDPPLPTTSWGYSAVERTCGRLIHLLAKAADGSQAEQVKNIRERIHDVRELAHDMGSKKTAHVLAKPPEEDHGQYQETLLRHILDWPGRQSGLTPPEELLSRAAAQAFQIGQLPGWSQLGSLTLADSADALQFVLALEVIECAFGDFEEFVEQFVKVIQIDSLSPAPVDPDSRGADKKVAGIQLGHFGGFLKRSWRANDWMWGRLDAVTHLSRILVAHQEDDDAVDRLRETLNESLVEALPADASKEAIAEAWAAYIQRDILQDELPKVAEAVRADLDGGGAKGTLSSHFLSTYDALEKATVTGAEESGGVDPEERPRFSDEALAKLLKAERIGEERFGDELGSDLATRTSVQALATTATVVHRGSPKLLRGAISAIRFITLLAWGLTRTAASRSTIVNAIGAVLFGAGLVVVAVDLFTDTNLSVLVFPAWIAFGAGLLIALTRAPFISLPLVALVVIPKAIVELPTKPWSWWGKEAPWLGSEGWDWLPAAGFVLAGLIIGTIRTPGWFVGLRRRIRDRILELDEVLVRTQETSPSPTPDG